MNEGTFLIGDLQIILRLLVAAVLGAVIGYERERQDQPAGLRTHMILAVGAALAMVISVNLAVQYRPEVPNGDPARLAAQVVSGIGFLGAGAILRFGNNIRGLTTATSLWTLAIIGMAVGAGHFLAGIATTVLLLLVLSVLDVVEKRLIKTYKNLTISIEIDDRPGILQEIRDHIQDQNTRIIQTSVSRNFKIDTAVFDLVIKTLENAPVEDLVSHLASLQGIKSFKIN